MAEELSTVWVRVRSREVASFSVSSDFFIQQCAPGCIFDHSKDLFYLLFPPALCRGITFF